MADYHTAYVLSLIGGILILVNGLVVAAVGGLLSFMPVPGFIAALGIFLAVIGIVFGVLVILGATMLNKKGKEKNGSVIVLLFSVLSLLIGGGFFIGFVLGLIGSILALTHK